VTAHRGGMRRATLVLEPEELVRVLEGLRKLPPDPVTERVYRYALNKRTRLASAVLDGEAKAREP
jgi:hypothetical protein